uniref:Protein kinase domain-containing protein n=1 Tax=Manihot esculenta TaxID=3983 RepID=A0A2C9U2F8_MANES
MYRELLLFVAAILPAATAQALPGCQNQCGDLVIPFPFGVNETCSLNEDFIITCNASNAAFLGTTQVQVLNISVQGQLRIAAEAAYDCYSEMGNLTKRARSRFSVPKSKFPLSYRENKFTAIGCDTSAIIQGTKAQTYATGCVSYCVKREDVTNGSCAGIGCCQTSIPKGVLNFFVSVVSFFDHQSVWSFNPCSYSFVVEEKAYEFSVLDLADLRGVTKLPVVLDWAIGNETCSDAQKRPETYACKDNSICQDSDNGPGYRCNCSDGYSGNPYLANGCRDIDECATPSVHLCTHGCKNTPGNYTCYCPKGFEGDGRKDGNGCTRIQKSPIGATIVVGFGFTLLLVASSWLYLIIRQRKLIKLREKFFRRNGGFMLQHELCNPKRTSNNATKIFTAEELKKATRNYDESTIIGKGGFGTVYKGTLTDDREVAIKKSMVVDQTQIEQFINEVIVLSQINHRNVVKLLGCCLETEVPLLVYEYISNGTLFEYVHNQSNASSAICWETRLKIAAETAGALSYLHSAASVPVIHRDVKTTNILLDANYTAKVSDFGASRLVPLDEIQMSTMVQGTLGYLDPEYLHTSQLTEKSDVYSFGVVLVELLTGRKALCFDGPEEERSLAMHFLSSMKGDQVVEIVEKDILNQGNRKQLEEVAKLAKRCLNLKGEERPSMKEIAMELEGLRMMGMHPWDQVKSEETEQLLNLQDNVFDHVDGGISKAGYYSMRDQVKCETRAGHSD